MRYLCNVLAYISLVFFPFGANATETKNLIPSENIEKFVIENFDLSTISSSLHQRMKAGNQSFFHDLQMSPSSIKPSNIIFESDDWFYEIKIKSIEDINGDGFKDIAICFIDKAKKGSYNSLQPILLTRYHNNDALVALSYEPTLKDCKKSSVE